MCRERVGLERVRNLYKFDFFFAGLVFAGF